MPPNATTALKAATNLATAANMGRSAVAGAVSSGAGGGTNPKGPQDVVKGAGGVTNAKGPQDVVKGAGGTNAKGPQGGVKGAGALTGAAATMKSYSMGPLNIQELMKLLTLLLPYFLVFLFIMISIINSNIKGFIYFLGLIFIYVIIKLFQGSVPNNQKEHICHIFDSYHYVHPSFISALYAYTNVYMITSMAIYNVFNIPLIIILLVFSIIDLIVRYKMGCADAMTIMLGSVIGGAFAVVWAYILKESGNKSLLYYDDLVSNKQSCSRASNEQFKCAVYKNGEVIKTL